MCKYCDVTSSNRLDELEDRRSPFQIWINTSLLKVISDNGGYTSFAINYCPICGNKLWPGRINRTRKDKINEKTKSNDN